MRKIFTTWVLIALFCGATLLAPSIGAISGSVTIDSHDYESRGLSLVGKDEKIEIEVSSDVAVNVYIMKSDDHSNIGTGLYSASNFSNNEHQELTKTQTTFTWTKPDNGSYYLVIFNPNDSNANVDNSYTTDFEEILKKGLFAAVGICIAGIVIVVIIIVVVIWLVVRDKKPMQQYPPPQAMPPAAAPVTQPQQNACPSCGGPIRYIQEYQRWYCDRCQKYL